MTLFEMAEKAQTAIFGSVIVALLSGIGWLVRRIFTNQAQIRSLTDGQIARDRRLEAMETDIREMRNMMMDFLAK